MLLIDQAVGPANGNGGGCDAKCQQNYVKCLGDTLAPLCNIGKNIYIVPAAAQDDLRL